jgi:hypothetical protein
MPELLTYSKFYTKEDAEHFGELMDKAGIEYLIEHERDVLDKIYIGETLDPLFAVKIPEDSFATADKILKTDAESQVNNVGDDYYLFSFTNEELIDVVNDKNGWNQFDQVLARKILSERKIEIPKPAETKPEAEFKPLRLEMPWLITEYLLSIVFGFIGIIIGVVTLSAYRTLSNGKKVKMYDRFTINNGKIILVIGIIRSVIRLSFLTALLKN